MKNKPLVFNPAATPPVQRLQASDDLDIPLADRVELLEERVRSISRTLLQAGFELEDSVTEGL